MKQENLTTIVEFEVIAPTNDLETVGEKIVLSEFGEYCPEGGSLRGYSLLVLLDHSLHYRVSKIMMQGKTYIIPEDRKKNYKTGFHPETMKYNKIPHRYDPLPSTSVASMRMADNGLFVNYAEVKHLF